MDAWMVALFVPTLAFLTIVAPVWIYMHYHSKQKLQKELSAQERDDLDSLVRQADVMLQRIETLEAILDKETPGWRSKQAQEYEVVSR